MAKQAKVTKELAANIKRLAQQKIVAREEAKMEQEWWHCIELYPLQQALEELTQETDSKEEDTATKAMDRTEQMMALNDKVDKLTTLVTSQLSIMLKNQAIMIQMLTDLTERRNTQEVDQVRDDNNANGDRWDGRREDRQDNMWDRQDSVERHHG